MTKTINRIEAHGSSIVEGLDNKKYTADYFKREHKWEERQIDQLVSDLTSSFLNEYRPEYKFVGIPSFKQSNEKTPDTTVDQWLKSFHGLEPETRRSIYREFHIEELYQLATREAA